MNLSFSLILALVLLLVAGFSAGLWFGRLLGRARADGPLLDRKFIQPRIRDPWFNDRVADA